MADEYAELAEVRRLISPQTGSWQCPIRFTEAWLYGVARDLRQLDMPDLEGRCIQRPLFLIACAATARSAIPGRNIKAFREEDAHRPLAKRCVQFAPHGW